MSEARGLTPILLDERASEPQKPIGIITSDRPGTREFDDGIAVLALEDSRESYRVSVFAVDTSHLYHDDAITDRVLERVQTRYTELGDGRRSRDPMLDKSITSDLHFSAHRGTRRALVISFIVGDAQPPSDVTVSFGEVEVKNNFPYQVFGRKCRDREKFKGYGRSAAFIMQHLRPVYREFEDIYDGLINVPSSEAWQRGENITKAFTICANHLVAKTMRDEDRLALFRTNYAPTNGSVDKQKDQVYGRYSTRPAPHDGLDLEAYTRVTSPLWRGCDFMMHGQLDARETGRAITERDTRLVTQMVQQLNLLDKEKQVARQVA